MGTAHVCCYKQHCSAHLCSRPPCPRGRLPLGTRHIDYTRLGLITLQSGYTNLTSDRPQRHQPSVLPDGKVLIQFNEHEIMSHFISSDILITRDVITCVSSSVTCLLMTLSYFFYGNSLFSVICRCCLRCLYTHHLSLTDVAASHSTPRLVIILFMKSLVLQKIFILMSQMYQSFPFTICVS